MPGLHSRELFSSVNFFGKSAHEDDAPKSSVKSKVGDHGGEMHEHWNRRYPSNRIETTRYTWDNFLPITFFLQFTKVINVFYLFNMILQAIPSVSTNGWQYTFVPLLGMVSLGMAKEFVADYKRYKMDKESNAMPARVLTGGINRATEDSRLRKREAI